MPFHVCAGSSRLGVAAAGPLAAVRLPQGPRRGVHIPGRAAGGFRPHSRQGQLCPLGTLPGLLPGMFFTFMVTRSLRIKTVIQKEPFCPLSACTLATGAETFAAISPKLRTARGAGTGVLGREPPKSASVYLRSPRGRFTYTGEERFSLFRQKDGLTTPLSHVFTHPSALRRGGARPLLEASVRGSRGHRLAGSLLSASRSFRFSRGVSQSALHVALLGALPPLSPSCHPPPPRAFPPPSWGRCPDHSPGASPRLALLLSRNTPPPSPPPLATGGGRGLPLPFRLPCLLLVLFLRVRSGLFEENGPLLTLAGSGRDPVSPHGPVRDLEGRACGEASRDDFATLRDWPPTDWRHLPASGGRAGP